ncbi:sulfite exporter TauE/SafE family protein [Tumidithrix elongata RA019]|uniref:Sulfite exporter TauE/SafE family protein n=1 Tax=Tumidithrix elongata BACA0141 TaxID=2716417 RepID=A0AAW9PYP0_9CYAN|nr:sulfite exporter TauE/SafE family protein [Tumidithrix elongata RA019]
MLDFLLVAALGFLGSFGHCIGMCGPVTVAFSLSGKQSSPKTWQQHLYFHGLLNLGRLMSYTLVGAGIGALGSALVASGQLAGIDSQLRHWLAIFTGSLLVWMGILQIKPDLLPRIPLFNPMAIATLHQRLGSAMAKLSLRSHWLTPACLGMVWGLIPCGFLYIAQLKAAETGDIWKGAIVMLAFGVGTLPSMLGIGISASLLSSDRRSQLFRMGGWITLTIGILTLLRTGEMVDYTGHAALFCLMLALVARPISKLWGFPLRYRRALGVTAFILSIAHTLHMVQHSFKWNLDAIAFMLPFQRWGIWLGAIALLCMAPAAFTSFDRMALKLGKYWRYLHLLTVPALILAVIHTLLIGSHYLGSLEWTGTNITLSILCGSVALLILLLRFRITWKLAFLEKFYVAPNEKNKIH